ncbi:hypothetical protein ACIQAL_30860 [Pseudomonas sp. NPDC088368]|uniref:hypothetical protein n=1 Tax=Pseudomonas sp. NPDC088368 TaxID=3364453 RepID=UPI003806AD6C
MKDAFTAALSDVVQNQVELTSTIESFLGQALSQGGNVTEADQVQGRLDSFNAHVNALIKALAERFDGLDA